MEFNWSEFNKLKTKATDAKLSTLSSTYNLLERDKPPMRGFCIKWRNNPVKAIKEYNDLLSKLFKFIETNTQLTDQQKDSFMVWEKFQSEQKGPAAPVSKKDIQKNVIDDLLNIYSFDLTEDVRKDVDEAFDSLFDYFGDSVNLSIHSINFENEWKKLPSTTVRGFPFHALGRDVDQDIIRQGGQTSQQALDYFLKSSQNICFPGWRIQGKPWPGPAKTRIVNIPIVNYQYLMVGITKKIMEQLAKFPMFDGWKEEFTRVTNTSKYIEYAKRDGFTCIQMDYSKFDRKIHPYFRIKVWEKISRKFSDQDFAEKFIQQFTEYSNKQFLFIGDVNNVGEYHVVNLPYQLLSGVIDTQLTGSIVNAVLQFVCAKRMGYSLNWDYVKVLGDDAVFPVPDNLLHGIGYKGVLEEISKTVSLMGFALHPGKAYPNTDVAFLQKLYVPSLDIKGAGTWARNMASFMFRERLHKKIPGIKSMHALEIISQISIISQAFSLIGTDLSDFAQVFADWWVKNDDVLRYILQNITNSGSNDPNLLFKTIVKISGATNEEILDFMDLLAYDHTGLSEKLHGNDYGSLFKILKYLLKSAEIRRPVNDKIANLIDSQDVFFAESNHEDLLDLIDDE